ncbi:MAG: DUF1080 domain-containing protein [Verrucomicrobia bacterium]|nr:DUF1080 domain-containing protein [Verrucomicrobiota bacterium]
MPLLRSSALVAASLLGLAASLRAQPRALALTDATGLQLHQAQASAVTFQGQPALRLTAPPTSDAQPKAAKKGGKTGAGSAEAGRSDHLALVTGLDFSSGTIEVELAGEPSPGAAGGARGFVGVAFRVQPDRRTYDCFYLRPTNGRAEDQERRNHTAQYISHPEHPWFILREKTPSRYESYVDIQPAQWIHVKITVEGEKARLYVNHQEQPTLIVNDVKSGATARGAVALWFEGSTVAHFRNLKITPR